MLSTILLQAAAGMGIAKMGATIGAGFAAIGAGIGIGLIGKGLSHTGKRLFLYPYVTIYKTIPHPTAGR